MKNIKNGFDFREMSKRILGKTWRKLSDAEKDSFTELMTKLLENVYIGKLESYSGQAIIFDAERIKGKRAQVTTLFKGSGGTIPIHYIMRKKGGFWRVYDINIEGVSLVRNYQEQFKSILRREKYTGLVKILKEKNWAFEQEQKLNAVEKEDK
jgi:phospholipid transport system substrate-binding protein